MNSTQFRNWSVLCWNIRGINASKKWDALKDKVLEVGCHIVCLQETKREAFDSLFVRKFLPPNFDGLVFVPSVGASGGILTAWKTSFLQGTLIFSNDMAHVDVGSDPNHTPAGHWTPGPLWTKECSENVTLSW